MGTLRSKYSKAVRPENAEEVFLAEALGHASAFNIHIESAGVKRLLLRKGMLISPRIISTLAAHGLDRIVVYRKPRISVIVIGDDLASPGTPLSPGKSYDFGTATLRAALETMRIRPVLMRRLRNEPKILHTVISFALNQSDMIILVVKEMAEAIRTIGNNKKVILVSNDPDELIEGFEKLIRPAITAFMGLARPGENVYVG